MSQHEPPHEFWREQAADDRRDLRKLIVRWALGFTFIFAWVYLVVWWSGAAVRFEAKMMLLPSGFQPRTRSMPG